MSVAIVDTDIIIDYIKAVPAADAWLNAQKSQLSITPTTWMEIIYGAKRTQTEQTDCLTVLARFKIEYFTEDDIKWAMVKLLRYRLTTGIGSSDCLIASVAFRFSIPLYTRNLKHMTPLLGNLVVQPYKI